MNNLLELKSVTKYYGKKMALNNVNLSIHSGKIIGLLGPNGSGKTTLIKTIMHIIREQQGEVLILNEKSSYETRKHISFMPDREFLYDNMKVKDAIKYYSDLFVDFDCGRADMLCQKLGLDKETMIDQLSKGIKEKVVLMLTLARNVPIYLLDEPLIEKEMLTVIKETLTTDKVIIISTNQIKDIKSIIDEAIFLKNGAIVNHFNVNAYGKDLEKYYLEVFANV